MRLLVAVLLAAAALAPAMARAQTLSPSEVVDQFHFQLKAGNRQKALELLEADCTVFEQGRTEKSRTEYARNHLADDMQFAATTQRTVSRRSVRVLGNAAWVMSVNRNRGKFQNRPIDFTTVETMVLARIGARWRIVHIHWSFDDKATAQGAE